MGHTWKQRICIQRLAVPWGATGKSIFSMGLWDWMKKKGIETRSDDDQHPFLWKDGRKLRQWLNGSGSFLTLRLPSLTVSPPTWRSSSWPGCDGQLLQRPHGASSWAVSQNQSGTTALKLVGTDWQYLGRRETLIDHRLPQITSLSSSLSTRAKQHLTSGYDSEIKQMHGEMTCGN